MNNAAVTTDNTVRPLRSTDLERVIAIDSAHVGEPRRRFFEKRLAHAKQHPEDFVHVGVVARTARWSALPSPASCAANSAVNRPLPRSTRSALSMIAGSTASAMH